MDITDLAEEAVDTAEFHKAYKVRKYAGKILDELETISIDSGMRNGSLGRIEGVKMNAEDTMFNTFARLDVKGNFEFEEFMEEVKEEMGDV